MRRGTAAQVSIRFDPSGLELDERELTFNIFANTTSKLIGDHKPEMKLNVHVVKRAELSLRGWARPEQSFYSGEVKHDNTMMQMEDVGSQLIHTYQVIYVFILIKYRNLYFTKFVDLTIHFIPQICIHYFVDL